MPDLKTIILNTDVDNLQGIISPFIEEQFPSFMRSDYRKLVLFIKSYYEWMEKEGNTGFVVSNLASVFDIDNNLENFYDYFSSTYLQGFPQDLAISVTASTPNKKTLLKKIKQFYGSKGTESAYKFLFRVLYDSDLTIEYPKQKILKASDGVWVEQVSIKTTVTHESELKSIVAGTIVQYGNAGRINGFADIDSTNVFFQDGVHVCELHLKNLVGSFIPNSSVTIFSGKGTQIQFTELTFSVLGEFFIQTPGENYTVGDSVYISTTVGSGFVAVIEQTGLAGSIKKIRIKNSGINYFISILGVVVSANGQVTGGVVLFSPTAITRYPGFWQNNRGKVSSTGKIYDGDYYQEFSYHLKSAVNINKYYDVLKQLIHPSGTKMFGSLLLDSIHPQSSATASSQVTRIDTPIIGIYLPYTFGTTLDLRANGQTLGSGWQVNFGGVTYGTTGDLYPIGYNPYIGSTSEVGPNGQTTALGSRFITGGSGGLLGFTYCVMVESGRTAHNPIGAPIGGLTAWRLGNEGRLTPNTVGFSPFNITGLTLWLKPENIGVCGGALTTGKSMDIWRDASGSNNHALPPIWDWWGSANTGVTVDKLRPTLVVADRGIPGRTGINFYGGVVYGPHTVWLQAGVCGGFPTPSGRTLGGINTLVPFTPGTTGEKILSGQFFRLTRGITLTNDFSVYIAFRTGVTTGIFSNFGLGLVSSAKKFKDFGTAVIIGLTLGGTETDHTMYHRSYYNIDTDISKRNSSYYFVNSDTSKLFYPYDTGLVGYRNNIGSTAASRMAYNPNTRPINGISLDDIGLGEWNKYADGRIRTFYRDLEGTNFSPTTALTIARADTPGGSSPLNFGESPAILNANSTSIGRFGSYCLPVLDAPHGTTQSGFITAALSNTSYSFSGVIYEILVYTRVLSPTERGVVVSYLSRKYNMQSSFPSELAITQPSATPYGYDYWSIEHHPNLKGHPDFSPGSSFGNITTSVVNSMSGFLYKSEGTVVDGVGLTADSYKSLGE